MKSVELAALQIALLLAYLFPLALAHPATRSNLDGKRIIDDQFWVCIPSHGGSEVPADRV